jgi:ribosome recycling factor
MLDEKSLESRMQKSVETLRKDLARVRTGLASPAMLDNVMVDYYGTKTPLPQMAAITVPEPRSLAIKRWDKTLLPAVEKGILASDLGITPQSDGTYVRITLPVLTGDRRKELAKTVRKIGEEAKVAVRNIRRDENEHLKKASKDAHQSEDALKLELDKVQQLTDKYVLLVDQIVADKEKDITTI